MTLPLWLILAVLLAIHLAFRSWKAEARAEGVVVEVDGRDRLIGLVGGKTLYVRR